MEENKVSNDTFEGRTKMCDERFARDKDRLDKLEDYYSKALELSVKLTGITESLSSITSDHEKRLKQIESKPAGIIDKVISAAISAVIAGAVGFIAARLSM